MSNHEGFFGPGSVSWFVHRETTVLFGGARALLLQAAHPLVIAGARETGFYERDPWKRLERTLHLTYAMTFGTKEEAQASADRINEVHRRINGVDPVSGKHYDALDPHLLLYVHAALVESALLFEHLTVGALDEDGRQRFHEEQMLAAELLEVPRTAIPPTFHGLREFLAAEVRDAAIVTDAAVAVADLLRDPPPEAMWRPALKPVGRWGFGTLPAPLREAYGEPWNRAHDVAFRATMAALKRARFILPTKLRFIEPYVIARARVARGA